MPLNTVGICMLWAANTMAAPYFMPVNTFTLAWNHSIEKTRWEEDYSVLYLDKPVLKANTARIKGTGSGMEPPSDAVLHNGWYQYQPHQLPETPLRLTRSEFTPDYELCIRGNCQPMENYFPSDGNITLLYPCTKAEAQATTEQ